MKTRFLIISLLAAGFAANADVDNSVKYGEKYSCQITTIDQKNYILDLQWNSEASKFTIFPSWEEKITYTLVEGEKSVDSGNFKDLGKNQTRAVLNFNFEVFKFTGSESVSSSTASTFYYLEAEFNNSYDGKGQRVLSVVTFKSSVWYEKYVLKKIKEVELVVAASTCSVNAGNLQ